MYWEPAKYVAQAAHAEDRRQPAAAQDQHGGGPRRRLRPLRLPARDRVRLRVHPGPAGDHGVSELDHAAQLRAAAAGRKARASPTTLVNPATEEPLAAGGQRTGSIARARARLRAHGRRPGAARDDLRRARRAAEGDVATRSQAHRDELLDLAVANGGNTRGDAKFDVDGAIFTLAAYADLGQALGRAQGPRRRRRHPARAQPALPRPAHPRAAARRRPSTSTPSTSPPGAWPRRPPCALLAGMPVVSKPATQLRRSSPTGCMEILVDGQGPAGGRALAARGQRGRPARARGPAGRRRLHRLQRDRRRRSARWRPSSRTRCASTSRPTA